MPSRKLIEKADIERLIVLVDDLDRCLPETAIETLEAIRLFVMLPRTAFVIGADEAMIRYAVSRGISPNSLQETRPRIIRELISRNSSRFPSASLPW